MKQILLALIALLVVLGIGYYLNSNPKLPSINTQPVSKTNSDRLFFISETCPHCQNVEKWLEENPEIKDKAKLDSRFISDNENKKLLAQKAQECQLDSSQGIGVPFLYTEGKCIMGDSEIISYLKELK
jgi:hypothetical protein